MLKLSAIGFSVMLAAPFPATAYTQADIDACTPDAFRLCQRAFPDKGRVVRCLVRNERQLRPRMHHGVQSSARRDRLA